MLASKFFTLILTGFYFCISVYMGRLAQARGPGHKPDLPAGPKSNSNNQCIFNLKCLMTNLLFSLINVLQLIIMNGK